MDSTSSTETFADVVTSLKRDYSVRRKLARAIDGSGSSSWPSARTEDAESCGNHPGATDSLTGAVKTWTTPKVQDAKHATASPAEASRHDPCLAAQVCMWPTATKQDAESSGRHTTDPSKPMHPGTTLTDAARNWPTPGAMISNDGETPETWLARQAKMKEKGYNGNGAGIPLAISVQLWKTPRTITGGGESGERKKELGREDSGGGDLQAQVETWPTPNQRDHKGSDLKTRNGGASLSHFAETGQRIHSPSSLQVPVTSVSGAELSPTAISTALRRRLNPAFVCWLMGWPWWWTNPAQNNFARSATASYLFKLRMHLASLLARWESFSPR